jgi:hypothetical protein
MSKTMDLASTEEESNCQVKIHGEYNHIVYFAQCGSESNHVKEHLFYFLQEAVDAMLAIYDDMCCQNSTNPSDHFLPQLFPNCKRAPLKDVFHHVKGVLDQITRMAKRSSHLTEHVKSYESMSKHVKSYESMNVTKIQSTTTFQVNLAS